MLYSRRLAIHRRTSWWISTWNSRHCIFEGKQLTSTARQVCFGMEPRCTLDTLPCRTKYRKMSCCHIASRTWPRFIGRQQTRPESCSQLLQSDHCLNVDLPHFRDIRLDNARCYKMFVSIAGMYHVAETRGIKVLAYMYSGAQNGKEPIDGHFATATKHIRRSFNRGNDVVMPSGPVKTVRYFGYVSSTVRVVWINREELRAFGIENLYCIERVKLLTNQLEVRRGMVIDCFRTQLLQMVSISVF